MKHTSKTWRLVAAIAVAALAAACSDGEISLGGSPGVNVPEPIIIKFEANPPQVDPGGTTTLSWEVEEADSVEIASAPEGMFQFHAGPFEELTGSTTVDGITATTDFVLTASKTVMVAAPSVEGSENETPKTIMLSKAGQIRLPGEPPSPNLTPQTSSATATITVTVLESALSADITADKTSITAGESTIIHWTVTPDTAQAAVTASDGSAISASTECVLPIPLASKVAIRPLLIRERFPFLRLFKDISMSTDGPLAISPMPAVGCAVVSPMSNTTYALKATDQNGKEATDAVEINVSAANINTDILVNDLKNAPITNLADPVHVKWTVSPAAAKVTVTASPSAECTPALPVDVESAEGSADCVLSAANTTFSIEARLGESSDDDEANAYLQGGNAVSLDIKADPWAFVTEEVQIEVKAADQASANTIESIKIGDEPNATVVTDKAQMAAGVKVRAKVPDMQGIRVYVKPVGATEPQVQKPIQDIVSMERRPFFPGNVTGDDAAMHEALLVTRVTFDPNDKSTFYYGTERKDFGKISVFRLNDLNPETENEFVIPIEDPLKTANDFGELWANNKFFAGRKFPVGAIAIREGKSNWIFSATTGIVMYSNDSGSTWNRLVTLFYPKSDGYDRQTCAGKTQDATSVAGGEGNVIAAMGQVCDMIAMEGGRLIIAYDQGIVATENIEAFISNPRNSPWVGMPKKGESAEQNGYVNKTVAHDLEQAAGKIFAATNKGVYVNTDGTGKSWASFAGGSLDASKPVYSLAYDPKSGLIFAGSDNGVHVTSIDAANWVKTDASSSEGVLNDKVFSLSVDPAYNQDITGPVVIAGTDKGIAVTRDGGAFWSKLDAEFSTSLGEVRSVAIAAIVDPSDSTKITYKISATGNGYSAKMVEVGAKMEIK